MDKDERNERMQSILALIGVIGALVMAFMVAYARGYV